ncbi:kinase-like domain-containing protein [Gigaspora rosea]|uniref:Kinase-like domain-containing protein n=1 Tax=Gigaspora rosea TaxID=44941 RepID=A0A397UDW8_9GLOM|nr:kinase-like domain-containing protein [Gigaspora rosea]
MSRKSHQQQTSHQHSRQPSHRQSYQQLRQPSQALPPSHYESQSHHLSPDNDGNRSSPDPVGSCERSTNQDPLRNHDDVKEIKTELKKKREEQENELSPQVMDRCKAVISEACLPKPECPEGGVEKLSRGKTFQLHMYGMRHILKSKIQEYYMRREKYETSYRENDFNNGGPSNNSSETIMNNESTIINNESKVRHPSDSRQNTPESESRESRDEKVEIYVDDCIKEFQLNTIKYKDIIEWIPFNRLDNIRNNGDRYLEPAMKIVEWIPFNRLNIIQKFDDGFLATWLDGVRDAKYIRYGEYMQLRTPSYTMKKKAIYNEEKYIQSHMEPIIIALKTLPDSQTSSTKFLQKFKNYIKCRLTSSRLGVYGLTQNIATNQYLMAFQYVNSGNLRQYLRINFKKLTWKDKLLRLTHISKDLIQIHEVGYIHCDFLSGNILQHKEDLWLEKIIKSYIADLGLSRNNKEPTLKKDVYGVMSYILPEILLGRKYTQAADIYSFGVVIAEIITEILPFDLFDNDLALKICGGLRLKFVPGTPDCYIKLAKLYMNSDPQKRPIAKVLFDEFSK